MLPCLPDRCRRARRALRRAPAGPRPPAPQYAATVGAHRPRPPRRQSRDDRARQQTGPHRLGRVDAGCALYRPPGGRLAPPPGRGDLARRGAQRVIMPDGPRTPTAPPTRPTTLMMRHIVCSIGPGGRDCPSWPGAVDALHPEAGYTTAPVLCRRVIAHVPPGPRLSHGPREPMPRLVDAAGAVDAQTAPTAPWKTRGRVFHSAHRPFSLERGHFYFAKKGDISISR